MPDHASENIGVIAVDLHPNPGRYYAYDPENIESGWTAMRNVLAVAAEAGRPIIGTEYQGRAIRNDIARLIPRENRVNKPLFDGFCCTSPDMETLCRARGISIPVIIGHNRDCCMRYMTDGCKQRGMEVVTSLKLMTSHPPLSIDWNLRYSEAFYRANTICSDSIANVIALIRGQIGLDELQQRVAAGESEPDLPDWESMGIPETPPPARDGFLSGVLQRITRRRRSA